MTMRQRIVLSLLAIWMALPIPFTSAQADVGATKLVSETGCFTYVMCDDQTATGICTALPASGEERVASLGFMSKLTFDGTQSIDAYSCDIYHSSIGPDALAALGEAGFKINTTSLSQTQETISFFGLLKNVWISCTSITTSVYITLDVCPAR